jgi:hypothetical protein
MKSSSITATSLSTLEPECGTPEGASTHLRSRTLASISSGIKRAIEFQLLLVGSNPVARVQTDMIFSMTTLKSAIHSSRNQ